MVGTFFSSANGGIGVLKWHSVIIRPKAVTLCSIIGHSHALARYV